jgi:hypothetical protein
LRGFDIEVAESPEVDAGGADGRGIADSALPEENTDEIRMNRSAGFAFHQVDMGPIAEGFPLDGGEGKGLHPALAEVSLFQIELIGVVLRVVEEGVAGRAESGGHGLALSEHAAEGGFGGFWFGSGGIFPLALGLGCEGSGHEIPEGGAVL